MHKTNGFRRSNRKPFFWKNALGHISKLLLDLLTSYSTVVIFHPWNGTLSSSTSSSAGGIISPRMSRTAWIKWSESADAWSFTRKTTRRPYSILTALEHERTASPACRQAVSCAICFRSETLCHFAHRRG